MKKIKFVFSSHPFEDIKSAEEKATRWFNSGRLDQDMGLYKVIKVYRPTIKFKEEK